MTRLLLDNSHNSLQKCIEDVKLSNFLLGILPCLITFHKTKLSKIPCFLGFINSFKMSLSRTISLSRRLVLAPSMKRHLSTTSILRLSENAQKEDLVVDYLDGDRSGIVVFGLNRPEAKNSFSKNLVYQLIDAVEAVKFDKGARVLILKSTTPGIFCAGADLKERAKMPANLVGAFVAKARKLISDLESLPMPVIAAIDGHALGTFDFTYTTANFRIRN